MPICPIFAGAVTFVRPPVIVIQHFGLLRLLTVMEKTCSSGAGVDHVLKCASYIINIAECIPDTMITCGFTSLDPESFY